MVDNSTSPCERISGWFYPHATVQLECFILQTQGPVLPFLFTMLPPAISWGISSLYVLSNSEVWHRRQRITEHFPHGPLSIGFPHCQSFGTLPVALRQKLTTSLSWLNERHPQRGMGTHNM